MKLKREAKLEQLLAVIRKALHKEKQKNRDLEKSRNKHKRKAKELVVLVKDQREALKKSGNS